jgi:hypothetical protein
MAKPAYPAWTGQPGRHADEPDCLNFGMEPQQKRSHQDLSRRRLHVIAYRATLDVPRELVQFAAELLLAERHRRGTPKGSRALSCFWQAVPGLRWFRDRTACDALARDHGISRATAYRYLDEVITVLAEQAPELSAARAGKSQTPPACGRADSLVTFPTVASSSLA